MIKCGCGRIAKDENLADISGWTFNAFSNKWTCVDCAIEQNIEAMEVA